VQVAAAGLRAVWPDPVEPVTALDDALNENPFAEGRDDVLTTKPSATERRPERPGRPRYTRDALEFWFVSRRNMPFETLPTEAEDHAAARAYFTGRVPRDPFREIRRKLTPPEWRKTGPRKKLPGAHPRDLSRD
jgi:hypothetical protein